MTTETITRIDADALHRRAHSLAGSDTAVALLLALSRQASPLSAQELAALAGLPLTHAKAGLGGLKSRGRAAMVDGAWQLIKRPAQ